MQKERLPDRIFVSGIGTNIGKTVVSAVLAEALRADYWKPIQCGDLETSDSIKVSNWLTNPISKVHPEAYKFVTSAAPHYAARVENEEVSPEKFRVPTGEARLIIEGAGGLMVPLNDHSLVIDLVKYFNASLILVVENYLGSINHTLLSLEAIHARNINLLGIIFNGDDFLDNEEVIQRFSKIRILGKVEEADRLNKEFIKNQSLTLRSTIEQYFEV